LNITKARRSWLEVVGNLEIKRDRKGIGLGWVTKGTRLKFPRISWFRLGKPVELGNSRTEELESLGVWELRPVVALEP
jgi:hypothetical protein